MAEKCGVCEEDAGEKVLTCDACRRQIHYQCTKLPTYYVVLLIATRHKYNCESCVMKKPGYEETRKEIEQTLRNEREQGDEQGLERQTR